MAEILYKIIKLKVQSKNICMSGVRGGLLIQATGRTDFEDGPTIGNQSEAGNSLQRVRTIPENKGIIVLSGGVDQVPPGADESPTC